MRLALHGMERVRRRPALIVAACALNLGLSWIATIPAWGALADLDIRAAASRIFTDDGLLAELGTDHAQLLIVALFSLGLALVLHLISSWILAGGVLEAFGTPAAQGSREVSAACGRHALRLLAVGLIGLVLRVPVLAIGWVAIQPLVESFGRHGFMTDLAASGAVLAGVGALWSLTSVLINGAQGVAVHHPRVSALRCLGLSWQGFRQEGGRALFSLAVLSGGGFVATTAVYHLLGKVIGDETVWGFAGLMILRVVLTAVRAWITLATLVEAAAVTA